jgi:hypothetical protein
LQLELKRLPAHLHSVETASPPYPVSFSKHLQDDFESTSRQLMSS